MLGISRSPCFRCAPAPHPQTQFGRAYTMEICLGDVGPVFKVTDDANGDQYAGDSPTKPWTDVCIAKKAGTRISGCALG